MSLAEVRASGVFVVPFKVENGFQKGTKYQEKQKIQLTVQIFHFIDSFNYALDACSIQE